MDPGEGKKIIIDKGNREHTRIAKLVSVDRHRLDSVCGARVSSLSGVWLAKRKAIVVCEFVAEPQCVRPWLTTSNTRDMMMLVVVL